MAGQKEEARNAATVYSTCDSVLRLLRREAVADLVAKENVRKNQRGLWKDFDFEVIRCWEIVNQGKSKPAD
jgi:hypothetical protein